MDLWQLRTLSAVARTLSFTRASEELHLSQPAVSHQIKALEKELGEKLFVRSRDGVELTAAGRAAYEHAQRILDVADDLKTELLERSGAITGKLTVGASFKGLNNPFYGLYMEFKKSYEDVELVFQGEDRPEDVIRKIREGSVDLGLVSDEFLPPDLKSIPYGEYKLQLVVGSKHRFAGLKLVSPMELAEEDWVLFDKTSRFRHYTDECFKEAGFEPKTIFETNDGSLINSLVSRGEYISLLPAWGVFEGQNSGGILPVEVDGWTKSIQVSLIWNPTRQPPVLQALIKFLLNTEIEGVDLFRLNLK